MDGERIRCTHYYANGTLGSVAGLTDILARLESSLGPATGEPAPLKGGITNHNFRVTLGGTDYVVRLPGKDTDLLGINRETERLATEAAARLGIAPAVAAAHEDYLVTRFIACRPVSPQELADDVEEIARALRGFHDSGTRLPARFWVPELLDDYATIVLGRGGGLPEGYPQAVAVAARIEAALPVAEPCACHDDLLGGNIIRAQDDGRMLIVDWEYAGMGDPRFDLGNLSINNDFDDAVDDRLLGAYYGEAPTDQRRAALKLMRVLSDAREAAWSVVQAQVSELDFDFERYGSEHFERLRAAAEQPRFGEWLAAAAG
jgi:thiamine kinase-like enzyme